MTDGPIFHVEQKGSLGSRMFQYLVALNFQALVPGSRISNVQLPEWGIDHPPIELEAPIEWSAQPHHIEIAGLAERASTGRLRSIVYAGHGQRLGNFASLDVCRSVFRPPVVSSTHLGERYLVCHVRAANAVDGKPDPHAPLTPPQFYADVVARSKLLPVFIGRGIEGEYGDRLRRQFPQAAFLDAGDSVQDFELIRQARNIALGVSSFAWLAAWLSHADRIFLAVNGRFNPMQDGLRDLLPFGDTRYNFHLFPINYAVPAERQVAVHDRIAPLCRHMPQDRLRRMFNDAPRFDPPVEKVLEEFDAAYYLARNQDVVERFGRDNAAGARRHYREAGVRERRMPFRLAARWYAEQYPMAALEVAQGDYSSFAQHYVAVGRRHGYRLLPDEADAQAWDDATLDDITPATIPPIAVLAKEVVTLERAMPTNAEAEVMLGDSFGRWLSPDKAATFNRLDATEDVHIFRLRDVILDVSMMALFTGRQPIRETMYMMKEEDYEYSLVKPLRPEQTNAGMHYIVGGNASVPNYYHWMAQSLPAIDWGVRRRRHSHIALAVPPLHSREVEALGLLGYAELPRLTLRPSAHYALGSAEYAEFIGARMDRIVSYAAAETYARLRQSVAPASDGADAIYVARTDATRRIVVNEDALIAMLERQGVRAVVPGTMPVARQLAIFRRARLVIGPHGAGLSNLIGCEPGTHVYEQVPSHHPNYCYNRLAQSCRLHYWADVFPPEQGHGGEIHDRPWRIDLDVVARRLDEIRARIAGQERMA